MGYHSWLRSCTNAMNTNTLDVSPGLAGQHSETSGTSQRLAFFLMHIGGGGGVEQETALQGSGVEGMRKSFSM